MATTEQNSWILKVLGVHIGGAGDEPPVDLAAARRAVAAAQDGMMTALSNADLQIRKLQAVLAVHPDVVLKEIAGSPDLGLNALTGNYRVRMLAALRDLDGVPPDKLPATVKRVRDLVAGFGSFIDGSPRLAACDENPLGIKISVRPLLTDALAKLSRSLERLAA